MNMTLFAMRWFALACVVGLIAGSALAQTPQYPETPRSPEGEKGAIPEAENQALVKINAAEDGAGKLAAASEFVKKFPKSPRRLDVARVVAARIAASPTPAEQIPLLESFLTVFAQPEEAELVIPLLIDAYTKTDRFDDAFRMAGTYIEKHPNDISALTQMALVGTEQLKRQNPKFAEQSIKYAEKAIELIEADKKPENMDAAGWNQFKTTWLPHLYQSAGLISYLSQRKDEARTRLEKAASLNAADPITFMLLGSIHNDEYQQLAKEHQGMADGPAKDDVLRRAHEQMDKVIQIYARTVALSSGNPQYQMLHDQVKQDLEAYYKYRNKGSTEGLQELIDKHKKPAEQK